MTPRERVLAALRCEEPDRVPFLETVVDEGVALALLGRPLTGGEPTSELKIGDELAIRGTLIGSARYTPLELVEALDLDGFGAYLFCRHEGVQEEVDGHIMIHGGRIKSRADLARVRLPDPDDPELYEPYRRFVADYRDTHRALFCFMNIGIDPALLSMGFETFSLMLYDDRALVEEAFALYTDWYARAVRHLTRLGFDFLWFGDDIAFKTGPYVSPRIFRELYLPYMRRVIDQVSIPWIFHSDGNLLPIMDDLLSLGMSGLHPIEPEAMDLGDLKRRYGGRVCFCGNISVDALGRATPEQIDALVKQAILTAGPGGGYIAGSANSIPYYCKPENVRAMQHAIRKYGSYPIGGHFEQEG